MDIIFSEWSFIISPQFLYFVFSLMLIHAFLSVVFDRFL